MKIRDLFTGRVFTISNLLSLARIILVPFAWYTFHLEKITGIIQYKYYTLGILIAMIITDFLDGFLARLLNQVSRLGQFLDPIADKIAAYCFGTLLFYYRDFPLWILIAFPLRDMFTLTGGILLYAKKDIQARPNFFGKAMITCMGISALIFILATEFKVAGITLKQLSLYSILVFIILSPIQYWKTYSKFFFGKS